MWGLPAPSPLGGLFFFVGVGWVCCLLGAVFFCLAGRGLGACGAPSFFVWPGEALAQHDKAERVVVEEDTDGGQHHDCGEGGPVFYTSWAILSLGAGYAGLQIFD